MSTTSMAIFSNPLFATYSVYARNASIKQRGTNALLRVASKFVFLTEFVKFFRKMTLVLRVRTSTTVRTRQERSFVIAAVMRILVSV